MMKPKKVFTDIKEANAEIDRLHVQFEEICDIAWLASLTQENAKLRSALKEFGQHKQDCPWGKPCTCGLGEALGTL